MIKKTASDSAIAFVLYYTFGLYSLIPAYSAYVIASKIAVGVVSYILIHSLLFIPISYFSLKYAAKSLDDNYVISNKDIIRSLFLKYLFLFSVIIMFFSVYFTGYISVGFIASMLALSVTAIVVYKFGTELIKESSKEEINSSLGFSPEPHLLKRIGKTALLALLGFVLFALAPLAEALVFGEQLGQVNWLVLIVYYVTGIFLFKKMLL